MKKILFISNFVLLLINLFLILWDVSFFTGSLIFNLSLKFDFFDGVYLVITTIIIEAILFSYYKFSKIKVDKLFIANIILTLLVSIIFIYFISIFFQG